ncbi:Uncharacterised protein [uncultured archaeon]|nr:Uncharacterised protein [uncultured archaeon]
MKIFKFFNLVLLSFILLLSSNLNSYKSGITNSTSTATISEYVAFALSNYFTVGINFGSVSPASVGNNATNNSLFTVTLSNDTSANAKLCTNSSDLISGGNTITVGNLSYYPSLNQTVLNGTSFLNGTNYTTTITSAITGLHANDVVYWNFWLNIPEGQSAGSYNGNVYFEGVSSGAC